MGKCKNCEGYGYTSDDLFTIKCYECDGSGEIEDEVPETIKKIAYSIRPPAS